MRGEGISGEKGEGFAGTIVKGTWTVTGGWKQGKEVLRAEGIGLGWREKAENYT